MNKCIICNNQIKYDAQYINGNYYHNKCIEQLQSNWNKLKQYIKEIPEEEFVNCEGYVNILDKMNELERGEIE